MYVVDNATDSAYFVKSTLAPQPSVYSSNICRYVEDVHEEVKIEKIIFDEFTAFLTYSHFLYYCIYNMMVNSAPYVKSTPRAFIVSFHYFASILQIY